MLRALFFAFMFCAGAAMALSPFKITIDCGTLVGVGNAHIKIGNQGYVTEISCGLTSS